MASFFQQTKPYDGLYLALKQIESELNILEAPAQRITNDKRKKEYIHNYILQLLNIINHPNDTNQDKTANALKILMYICNIYDIVDTDVNTSDPNCIDTLNKLVLNKDSFYKMLRNDTYQIKSHSRSHRKSPSKSHNKSSPSKSHSKSHIKYSPVILHPIKNGGRRTKRQIQNRRRKTQSKYT